MTDDPIFTIEEARSLQRAIDVVARHDRFLKVEAKAFPPGVAESLLSKVESRVEAIRPHDDVYRLEFKAGRYGTVARGFFVDRTSSEFTDEFECHLSELPAVIQRLRESAQSR